ncbi:MAG TPA: hypothetical protein VHS33_10230 [Sphingomicrobium sp.]|nr:hypothetical protein [Sphingomicrobium sp.]
MAAAVFVVSLTGGGAAAARTDHGAVGRLAPYMTQSTVSEVALARSAAPASLSSRAEILVFGPSGYRIQSKGSNGFACLVERSWAKDPGDREFWNPKVRAPMCLNPAAVQSVLPSYLERTKWVLAGATEAEVRSRIQRGAKAGTLPPPRSGAMSYMMSKEQYLTDEGGHPWRPHVMFYFPASVASGTWGANLEGSPVISDVAKFDHVITFMVPVSHWSDGSAAAIASHSEAKQER